MENKFKIIFYVVRGQKMKDIDILEEKEKEAIKDLEEYLHREELQGFSMLPRDKHIETLLNLVSTLIAENKELKEEKQELQKYMKEYLIPKSTINLIYISKSKVEEIIHNNKPHIVQEKLQSLLRKE